MPRNTRLSTRTGRKKSGRHADPARAVRREAAARHHAMDVRMQLQVLPPGMQYRQHADLGAQVLRVRGHLDQGLRGGPHQQAVDFTRVGQGDRVQRPREREDDVEVRDVEQVGRLRLHPPRRRGAVTLRAVAVAAGVVADLLIPALRAAQDMPAQGRRAAGRQVVQGPPLLGGQAGAIRLEERRRNSSGSHRPHRAGAGS